MSGNLCDDKLWRRLIRKGRDFMGDLKCMSRKALVCCLTVMTLICAAREVCAQRNLFRKDVNEPADDGQRLPSDRRVAQQLQDLTRQARGGDLTKIRDTLQMLQAAEPSLMVADGNKSFRPLHRDLIERIQAFPKALQEELLNHPGATPRALQIAFEEGGPAALVTFLHRHSGSTESLKAHLFLAAIHRDRGHRQATLYWLQPVLHSGAPMDLKRIAIAIREELKAGMIDRPATEGHSSSHVEPNTDTEDRHTDLTANVTDAESSLEKPTIEQAGTVRQTIAHSQELAASDTVSGEDVRTTSNVFPHAPVWQRTLHLNSSQRHGSQNLVRLLAENGDQQAIAWMAGEPVVDSQAIYVRSSGGVLAFDRKTGRVLWTRPLDRPQEVRRMADSGMGFPNGRERPSLNVSQLENSPEILELHRDSVTVGMTSDASRLFALCDTGEAAGISPEFNQPFGMLRRTSDMPSRSIRELVAIEKTTGRRLWSAGGAPLEARFGNELSRAWFAGPPTVSGGMLFGLVERDDAHWLVCLRSETGEVLWKLMLAYPETNIYHDQNRQMTASRPLVAEGMVYTSTNDGWLIAIDALTRSVVWTRRMLQSQSGTVMPQLRNLRSAAIQFSPQPFRQTWRPEAMRLLSDTLLVQGADSHQLLMIDPLTGGLRRSVSPDTATVILNMEHDSIIVAGPKKIQRLQLDNLNVVWATELTVADIAPIGPGTRLDDHLLIPLSDGSIQVVRYSDGQLTDNIPAVRPAFSAGGLKLIEGDVVSYGPDHVSLYSQSGTTSPLQPDLLEQAKFLIETGQFEDAENVLSEFPPTSEKADAIHRLLFRIATARTLNDPTHYEGHLQNATRYASTSYDRAIVQFLTLEMLPEVSGDLVVEFLRAAPAVLNAELPESAELKKQLLSPVADDPTGFRAFNGEQHFHTTRPLRDLLLQQFEQNLASPEAEKSASWLSALKKISDEDLLSIKRSTLAVQDELIHRADAAIEAGKLTESTWHLILHARHCEHAIRSAGAENSALSTSSAEFMERFYLLVDRFRERLSVESARLDLPLRPHPAALNLLDVIRGEMDPDSAEAKLPTPQELLAQQWSTWEDRTYSVVPVNPVSAAAMPQPNERMLTLRCREDRFLSGWSWSTYREPSVLAVRSLTKPGEPLCSIDGGMFDAMSLGNNGSVMRLGSVVLVQNAMGLSAVSVIDQQVLWSRRIPNQSSRGIWQLMAEMHLFDRFLTALPAWQEVFGRELRICGGNDRWICVQSPSRVEMIDLLTGRNLWSVDIQPGIEYAFATESCVFLSQKLTGLLGRHRESEICLNRIDGKVRETVITQSQLHHTVLATGDELLICEQLRPGSDSVSLNWINSVTGEKTRSLPLTNMMNCQFMDARTLVSVTSKGTFEIIDLLTAKKQIVHFAADVNFDATAEKGATPDHLSRAMIFADPANYYVFPFPGRQAGQMQIMLGLTGELNLYPIEKELRVIDRATGKIRWVWEGEDGTNVWFEPTADPVLLLVNFTARKNNANAPQAMIIPGLAMRNDRRTTITALSRMSGSKLFDYTITSRFPVPGLEFKITQNHHLDLKAFGNRVRFIPESDQPAAP